MNFNDGGQVQMLQKYFIFQVAAAACALFIISFAQLVCSIVLKAHHVELFKATCLVLFVSFVVIQLYFRWAFDSKFYNAIDYACLLLGVASVLGLSTLVLNQYEREKGVIAVEITPSINKAAWAANYYITTYCSSPQQPSSSDNDLQTRCAIAAKAATFFKSTPSPTLNEITDFLEANMRQLDNRFLYFDAKDQEPASNGFKNLFARIEISRDLMADLQEIASQEQEVSYWAGGVGDDRFKAFSLWIAVNAVFCKLGLILSKRQRA